MNVLNCIITNQVPFLGFVFFAEEINFPFTFVMLRF